MFLSFADSSGQALTECVIRENPYFAGFLRCPWRKTQENPALIIC